MTSSSPAPTLPEPQSPPPTTAPSPPQSATPDADTLPPPPAPSPADTAAAANAAEGDGEDGEDEYECGFCLFMKGGGCKDEFIAWEKCVEVAQETGGNLADKCFEVTDLLKKCMDKHADYYEPILQAEKDMAAAEAGEAEEVAESKE